MAPIPRSVKTDAFLPMIETCWEAGVHEDTLVLPPLCLCDSYWECG